MPKDIEEYQTIMMITGGVMGLKMYNRCEEIIDNNPDYFPWEHRYKSIPEGVHKAYLDEKYPERDLPLFGSIENNSTKFDGIIPSIMNNGNNVNFTINGSIIDMFQELINENCRRRKEDMELDIVDKALWDKHYSKYKLEYRKKDRRLY